MSFLDWLLGRPQPAAPDATRAPSSAPASRSARTQAGGRTSVDTAYQILGLPKLFLGVTEANETWRLLDLDSNTLSRVSPADLLELLADTSPEVSRALWDFIRMCNAGYEWAAFAPGTQEPSPKGQAVLDAFQETLRANYGAADVQINRLFFSAFLRGGFAGEIVFDASGRVPVDLAVPDPASIRFQVSTDPVRGIVYTPGQFIAAKWTPLDIPTFRYVPVDPAPGKPQGRAIATPALFSSLFLIGLLHDLRRVVAQQGYPRLDLSVDLEKLAAAFPGVAANPDEFDTFVADVIKQVQDVYSNLEPDDAYIHTSTVTVNGGVGAIEGRALQSVQGLIEALERMAVRSLKTMPLVMGITDGVSEANANRQWEIHAAGIKSLQHLCESLLQSLLSLAMQAAGVQADVKVHFSELRAAEELRDQQTLTLKLANAKTAYEQGYIDQDEAANMAVGHDAAQKTPRSAPAPQATPTGDTGGGMGDNMPMDMMGNPEPGSAR